LLGVGATCGEDGRLLAPKGEKRSSIEGFLGRGKEGMEWTFAVCYFGIDRMEAAIGGCLSIGLFSEVWIV
jgi:hypothetical protein